MYDEVVPLLDSSAAADKPSSAGKIKGAQVLDIITGIFSAILPALVAGGMLKGLLALAEIFGVNTGTGTCQILSMISDVPFYFLPFLLAISAARKFKVNEYLGICMAGALMYPTFVEAIGADPSPFTFLGFTVPVFSYADSVFPVILGVGLLAIVYHFIDRFIPDVLKMVLVPMLSLVISVPLALLVFAPIGAYGGLWLADGIVWLFSLLGPVAGFLLGFFAAGGVLQLVTAVANEMFPKNRGVITSIVMIASSVANYLVVSVAGVLTRIGGTEGPRLVLLFNMAVTLIGILLALYLNISLKRERAGAAATAAVTEAQR